MTAEQCAARQAAHENLLRELAKALLKAHEHLEWIGWGDSYERRCAYDCGIVDQIDGALDKAKEQGYA